MFKSLYNKLTNSFKSDNNDNVKVVRQDTYSAPHQHGQSFHQGYLSKLQLEEIYRANGIGKRIVDILVEDATRGFVDCDADLMLEFKRIKAKQMITDAGCFGRLFGGAMVVAFVDDYQDHSQPLNLKTVNKIDSLKVYDRWQATYTSLDLNMDVNSEFFNQPEYFTIALQNYEHTLIRVHRSRCFVFGGERTTNLAKLHNLQWEYPILNKVQKALFNYLHAQESTISILEDFVQTIFKMADLSQKFMQGSEDQIRTRVDFLNYAKKFGTTNILLMDKDGEDYEKKASAMGGYSEALDRISEYLCAVSGIPASRLFGRSPAGLNSTGQGDMQNYYDSVRGYRSDSIEPCIDWLIQIIAAQKSWKGKTSNLHWEFPSLTAPTEIEKADIAEKYAKIDLMYANVNAIDARDAYKERFGHGKFHTDIKIDVLSDDEQLELDSDNMDLTESKGDKEKSKTEETQDKIHKIVQSTYEKVSKK